MNQLASRLFYHCKIYRHFLIFAIKYMLEYRLNFLVRSVHNFTYVSMFFITTFVIFSKTQVLGGWNLQEVLLLFSLTHISYGLQTFLFMRGIEEFMRLRIRKGSFDLDLLKPANPQFLALFRVPWVDSILFTSAMTIFLVRQILILKTSISWLNLSLFLLSYIFCTLILYLIMSTYATLAFYVTSSQQVIYFMEKAGDFAQYPTHIFPQKIQWLFFTFIPVSFSAYIPASILLGQNVTQLFLILILMLPILFTINYLSWQKGLKSYSSASS